jgi:hypothetical protein
MSIPGQHAVGIKGAVDGSLIIEHQVRVVPLASELKGWSGAAAEGRIVVGVQKSCLALEIGAGSLSEISTDAKAVSLTARRAEKALAAEMRNRAVGAAPTGSGRDAYKENVVAGDVGMELSPACPAGINVEMAAHIKSPWSKDGIYGQEHRDAERKSAQHLHQAAGTGLARSLRHRRGNKWTFHNSSLKAAVSVSQAQCAETLRCWFHLNEVDSNDLIRIKSSID